MAKVKWQCASCGGRNDDDRHRCRLCAAPRPGSLQPEPQPHPTAPPPPDPEPHEPYEPMPSFAPQLPPIGRSGLDAEPLPTEPPPSGPNRSVLVAGGAIVVLLVAIFGFVVVTSGGDSSSTTALRPDETVGSLLPETTLRPGPDVPTENQMAVAMLPNVFDLGAPWAQTQLRAGADAFELGPNPSSADCITPTPAVPEAGARVSLINHVQGGGVNAQVKIFADPTAAAADFSTPEVTEELRACAQQSANEELGREGIAGLASIDLTLDELAPPGIGEESSAQKLTLSISAPGFHLSEPIVLIRFRSGRTVGVLSCAGGTVGTVDSLMAQMQDVFTSRFQPL